MSPGQFYTAPVLAVTVSSSPAMVFTTAGAVASKLLTISSNGQRATA